MPLVIAAAITAALAPGALRLRLQGDLLELLPRGAEASRALRHYVRTFGRADPVTVLVTGGDPESLADFAARFERRVERLGSVRSVETRLRGWMTNPADARAMVDRVLRLLDDPGIDRAHKILTPVAIDESVRRARALLLQPGGSRLAPIVRADPLELRRLLAPIATRLGAGLDADPASGLFLSREGDALVVLVRARVDAFDEQASRRLLTDLRRAASACQPGSLRIEMTGGHAIAVASADMIRADLKRSSMLSMLLVLAVFALAFGRVRALIAVAPPLVLGALWTAGFSGYALGRLNAISVAFVAILLGLGDDLATHLYLGFESRLRQGHATREAAALAITALLRPTLVAATTGALGFLALQWSGFVALRDLGVLSAAGIVLTALAVVLMTPALSTYARAAGKPSPPGRFEHLLASLGRTLARRRVLVLSASACSLLLVAWVGPPRFARDVVSVRPQGMAPLEVQRELFARFGGEPGQIVALVRGSSLADALERNDGVAEALGRLQTKGVVAGYSSLATLFPSPRTQRARLGQRSKLGLDRAAAVLEQRLMAHGFRLEPFANALAALRAPPSADVLLPDLGGKRDALLIVRHLRRDAGGFELASYARPARSVSAERLATELERAVGPIVRVTGFPLLDAELRRLLPEDLGRVGIASLVLVLLTLLVHFRAPGPAAVALVSVGVGIGWSLLLARAMGLEWTAYNLIVLPVLVGIAIDENVFLVHGHLGKDGEAVERAASSLGENGRAVITTGLTTAAGFATLAMCRFDGLRSLGALSAAGIVGTLAASLLVTPALMTWLKARPVKKQRK